MTHPLRRSLVLTAFWLASAMGRIDGAGADGLTYLVHEPTGASAHPPLIVLLHGSGADERDMITLWPQLPGAFVVVSPRAPFPDRGGGYRWYRKGSAAAQAADITVSRKIVDLMIENAISRFGVDPDRVFIGGFSQGAVMVYALALHERERFRGAAVLSGTLFASSLAQVKPGVDWGHDAFFLAHGTADRRIPLSGATSARAALTRLNAPLAFHVYDGMGHETGAREIDDLRAWLSERLNAADRGQPPIGPGSGSGVNMPGAK